MPMPTRTPAQRAKRNAYERLRVANSPRAQQKAVERNRRWRQRNPAEHRDRRYRRKYQFSLVEWTAMFLSQGSACAICGTGIPGNRAGWATDHCHRTGKVRGILCHGCNVALGAVKDNPVVLAKLIRYLEHHT